MISSLDKAKNEWKTLKQKTKTLFIRLQIKAENRLVAEIWGTFNYTSPTKICTQHNSSKNIFLFIAREFPLAKRKVCSSQQKESMASALNVISILLESFGDLQCNNSLSYIEEGSCKYYDKPWSYHFEQEGQFLKY